MNAFSVDYLSSNFNHVYSLVKENLSTTSNYLSALVKKNLSPILNDQQQRIALIAAGVFASLIASYALYRCCCRRKQIVPVKDAQVVSNAPQDNKINSSNVAAPSTHADKKGKKKKKKAGVNKEVVTTVATVAANQLGVSGGKAPDNQVNPGNTASDTAPAIDNGPAVAAPTNVDDDSKEERAPSPEPVERKKETPPMMVKTTPNRTIHRPNWTEREINPDGSTSISTGHAQVTYENGRGSLRFNGKVTEDNGTVATLTYDQREKDKKDDYRLDHPTYGLYQGTMENEILTGTRTFKNGTVQTGIFHKSENGEYLLNDPNGKVVLAPSRERVRGNQCEVREEQSGQFVNGLLNGIGERIRTATELVDNKPQGEVTRMVIRGTFVNSVLQGPNGFFRDFDGNSWKGTFENNHLNDAEGEKFIAKTGDNFKGVFVGHKFLQGKKTLANGDVLEGPFFNDQLNGKGTKTLVNERLILEGNFVHGKLSDFVTISRLDLEGNKIEGSEVIKRYSNDEPVKDNEPIAVNLFSSSRARPEENKQGVQPPVGPTAQPVLRTFGAPAKTSSTIAPAKGPITFSSGTVASTTSATIAPVKGPLRFPSLRSVNAQEQQGQ